MLKGQPSGLISKSMASQTGQQIITIHILPNISRIKGNPRITFGQIEIIKYSMINIFIKKYAKHEIEKPLVFF